MGWRSDVYWVMFRELGEGPRPLLCCGGGGTNMVFKFLIVAISRSFDGCQAAHLGGRQG